MKLIVTGANGFLGKTFCEIALKNNDIQIFGLSRNNIDNFKNNNFHIIKCDINNYEDIKSKFSQINPDIVFHFAANPSVKDDNISVLETNVIMTDKLLRCSKNTNFVFASSATVYGQLLNENSSFTEKSEIKPESIYATSKVLSEELIKFYHRSKSINKYIIYRYVANAGKYSTHGVLPDIIRKIKNAKDSIEIFGSYPGTVKPFTLASQSMDISLNNTLNVFKTKDSSIFNISPNDAISVDDLINIAMININKFLNKTWLGESSLWKGDQKYLRVKSKFSKKLYSSYKAIESATKELMEIL